MPSCIVKGCDFQWRSRDPSTILHSFPSDASVIRSWLLQTGQDFGSLDEMCHRILASGKGQYRICSQHFSPDCYYQRGMLLSLKKDALPTIFPDEAAIAEKGRRKKRRRSGAPQPDDPVGPAVDVVSGSEASPEFPLKVISVDQDELPLFDQEPVTLISEDGYYMTAESYIQKRKQLSGPRRDFLPLKRRTKESLSGQSPAPTLTDKRGGKSSARP